MIALDTNVLLRYLVRDDPRQAALATEFVEMRLNASNPGFISVIVLAELNWTLKRLFKVEEYERREIIRRLIAVPQLVLEKQEAVDRALAQDQGDFTDVLIHELGRDNGCEATVTFDKKLTRVPGVELLG